MKFQALAAAAALIFSSAAAQAVTWTPDIGTPMNLTASGGGVVSPGGGTNALVPNGIYSGTLQANGLGAGYAIFEFSSATDPLGAFEVSSVLPNGLGSAPAAFTSSMEVAWLNVAGRDELIGGPNGTISGDVSASNLLGSVSVGVDKILDQSEFMLGELLTTFTAPNTTQYLAATWTGVASGDQASLRVQAVPGPLGVLLLGTAFMVAGVARRASRKEA